MNTTDNTNRQEHTMNTIPDTLIRRAQRAARTVRDMDGKNVALIAQGTLDGILWALEEMCDAAEVDALCGQIDQILAGEVK
jgi:ERCC4-related helicase